MQQYTVIIADDERLVIEDLSNLVDWNALGFRIVATAPNGKTALSLYNEYKPDIVITDIQMPFMDGLKLIKEIRRNDKNVFLIILTAYSDFEFIKDAMNSGANNYIVKSELTEEFLTKKLIEIRDEVKKQHAVSNVLSQDAFSDWFNFIASDKYPQDICHEVCSFGDTQGYYLIINEEESLNERLEGTLSNLTSINIHAIKAIEQAAEQLFDVKKFFPIADARLLIMLKQRGEYLPLSEVTSKLGKLCEKIIDLLEMDFHIYSTAYFYPKTITIRDFRETYKEHFYRIHHEVRLDKNRRITNLSKDTYSSDFYFLLDEQTLEKNCIDNNYTAVLKEVENIFKSISICNNRFRSINQLYCKFKNICSIVLNSNDSLFELSESHPIYSYQDFEIWLKAEIVKLSEAYSKNNNKNYSQCVIDAITYIDTHYQNPELKVKEIAESVLYSESYFSVLFKKETGFTVNEYITKVRINNAKNMLEKSKYKVYEVAEKVGYSSSQYFSQIFYSLTGVKPTDYKGK